MEERREEIKESLDLVLSPNLTRKYRYLWAQIKVYVRKSKKKNKTWHYIIIKNFIRDKYETSTV